MVSYALTDSENGLSIKDISENIQDLISDDIELLDLFQNKLIDYGYFPEIFQENLYKFIVDKVRVFHVSETFPKILSKDLKSQIISVKYSIDLSKCIEYEVDIKSIFKN